MAWTQAVSDLIPGEVVASDGKTVRRSHDRNAGQRAIHPVSWYRAGSGQRWASANTLTLGQVKTTEKSTEKSNEITAISPVAANAGTEGVHRHYRRHGLPAGDRPGDSGPGR